MKKKVAYQPPQITKVVLRREQAVLSVCSSGITNVFTNAGMQCTAPGDCSKNSAGGDSNDNS